MAPAPRRWTEAGALACAVALFLASPAEAAEPPDPTDPGPLSSARYEYDAGPTVLTNEDGVSYPGELHGEVTLPSGAGPFPVIAFIHGNHATCRLIGAEVPLTPCPEGVDPVDTVLGETSPLPNYQGYRYLADFLASHGYLSVSIDANYVNQYGNADTTTGARERAQLIARTLALLERWNETPAPPEDGAVGGDLVGRVDLSRIGMMGHSRGGEGVTRFIEFNRNGGDAIGGEPSFAGLKAVMSYAGTDYGAYSPHGVAYGVYAPRCDGDVYDDQAIFAWDRGRFADPAEPAARVLYTINGTNHNFGNQEWLNDDYSGSDRACDADSPDSLRLDRAEQEENTIALVGTFLRRYVGPEPALDPYLTGQAMLEGDDCPESAPCDTLYTTSYLAPAAERRLIVGPSRGETPLAETDEGEQITTAGLSEFSFCDPRHSSGDGSRRDPGTSSGCPTNPTRSRARQLTLEWNGPASLTAPLAGNGDISRYRALTLRTAVNFDDPLNPEGAEADFEVSLLDASGAESSASVARHSSALLPPPSEETRYRALFLGGVRIPLAEFSGVDLTRVEAVRLSFGSAAPTGSIQLAELGLQELWPATKGSGDGGPGALGDGPPDSPGGGEAPPVALPAGVPGRCANEIEGTRRPDKLRGSPGDDGLDGLAGNDALLAMGGSDCLQGGADDDLLRAGRGDDSLRGGGGADRIAAGAGDDLVIADRDRDPDLIDCGPGDDTARAARGDRLRRCERIR